MAQPPCCLSAGGSRDWRGNAILAVGFFALFISGLLSAPFTFVFATPAYIAICAAMILTRATVARRMGMEDLRRLHCACCSFFGSGLLDYYLGTVATAGRTPTAPIAWDRLLSAEAWLQLFRDQLDMQRSTAAAVHQRSRRHGCMIAALCGAALAIVTRRGDIRTAACGLDRLYRSRARLCLRLSGRVGSGPLGVLSSHFLMLSCLVASFACLRSFPSSSRSA